MSEGNGDGRGTSWERALGRNGTLNGHQKIPEAAAEIANICDALRKKCETLSYRDRGDYRVNGIIAPLVEALEKFQKGYEEKVSDGSLPRVTNSRMSAL